MGTNVRRKKAVAKKVVEIFIREGKVLDPLEWSALEDKPFNVAAIRTHLGSWNRMLSRVKTAYPDLWKLIGTEEGEGFVPEKKVDSIAAAKKEESKGLLSKIKDAVTKPKESDDPIEALQAAMAAAAKAKASEIPEN